MAKASSGALIPQHISELLNRIITYLDINQLHINELFTIVAKPVDTTGGKTKHGYLQYEFNNILENKLHFSEGDAA